VGSLWWCGGDRGDSGGRSPYDCLTMLLCIKRKRRGRRYGRKEKDAKVSSQTNLITSSDWGNTASSRWLGKPQKNQRVIRRRLLDPIINTTKTSRLLPSPRVQSLIFKFFLPKSPAYLIPARAWRRPQRKETDHVAQTVIY
jgi:hypothetical protein